MPNTPLINEQNLRQDQLQITFTLICGCLSLAACNLLAFPTFLLLNGLTVGLVLSLRKWLNWAQIESPQQSLHLDFTSQIATGILIFFLGTYFLQLNQLSQMLFCSVVGSGLGGFFIHQCIIGSQQALNQALKKAAQQSQFDEVSILLERGADPFAPDHNGNNAFHHAIRNHFYALEIVHLFKATLNQNPITFKNVLAKTKILFNENVSQAWHELWQTLKAAFREHSLENRTHFYNACLNLFNAYLPPFQECLALLTHYLRGRIAFPKDLQAKNHSNQTALDFTYTILLDEALKQSLIQALSETPLVASPSIDEPITWESIEEEPTVHNQNRPRQRQ